MLELHFLCTVFTFYAQYVIPPTCLILLRELILNAMTRIILRSYLPCFIQSMGKNNS